MLLVSVIWLCCNVVINRICVSTFVQKLNDKHNSKQYCEFAILEYTFILLFLVFVLFFVSTAKKFRKMLEKKLIINSDFFGFDYEILTLDNI